MSSRRRNPPGDWCRPLASALGFALWLPLAATAATYHVSSSGGNDGNPGTPAAPWATLTKANAALVAGDTVIVHAGTYDGQKIEPAHSGAPGSYLTYRSATGEALPVITASPDHVAIVLRGNHHIWIEGLKVSGGSARPPLGTGTNLNSWAILSDASYNVFQGNVFEYAHGYEGFSLGGRRGSCFNRIVGNTLRVTGTFDNGKEPAGAVMAANVFAIGRGSDGNLVEGNDMRYGGHNVFEVAGSRNLVRRNFFDNNWAEIGGRRADGTEIGYRVGAISAIGKSAEAVAGVGYNLFEDNIVTGTRQTKYAESRYVNPPACKVEGTGQIVRGNLFIDNCCDALSTAVRGNGVPVSCDNHIFNNTFFGNGGALWRIINYENDPAALDGNVFVNNLAFRNRLDRGFSTGEIDADLTFSSARLGGAILASNRIFHNAVLDPEAGAAAVLVRGLGRQPLAWFEAPANGHAATFADNRALEPRFVPATGARDTREEFDLAPGSPLIDAGAFLTQTTAASGDALTVVAVADAGYFFAGIPELDLPGDLVRIGTGAATRVIAINRATDTLTLATPVSWSGGPANVSLDYHGKAPDIGARECAADPARPAERTSAPNAP